jgi:hypothetical protein
MAPKRGLSIERTSEYEDFMKELAEFHEKRGYVTWYALSEERYVMLTGVNAALVSRSNLKLASDTLTYTNFINASLARADTIYVRTPRRNR